MVNYLFPFISLRIDSKISHHHDPKLPVPQIKPPASFSSPFLFFSLSPPPLPPTHSPKAVKFGHLGHPPATLEQHPHRPHRRRQKWSPRHTDFSNVPASTQFIESLQDSLFPASSMSTPSMTMFTTEAPASHARATHHQPLPLWKPSLAKAPLPHPRS